MSPADSKCQLSVQYEMGIVPVFLGFISFHMSNFAITFLPRVIDHANGANVIRSSSLEKPA